MEKDINPKILDLSKEQLRVFNSLKAPQNPTQIAKEIKLPRTTISYILKELVDRGLVTKKRHGKRYLYTKSDTEKLNKLTDEVRLLLDNSLSDIISIPSFEDIKVYKGIKSIIDLQTKLLKDEPRHSRVKVIQPNKSFIAMFDNASVEEIIEYNKAISESKVILDAILEDNAYDEYLNYWKVDPEGFERLNPSYLERTTDYVEVKRNSISFSSELWIYTDLILIINWSKKNAILIKNLESRGLLEALYDTLKSQGDKVDHTTKIVKLK